ncbi:MAG TPA: hypothetical protein VEC14_02590 [Reyranellaceae bacterium]|nr:hypothetical protein [Reyranellaceae bacterium]
MVGNRNSLGQAIPQTRHDPTAEDFRKRTRGSQTPSSSLVPEPERVMVYGQQVPNRRGMPSAASSAPASAGPRSVTTPAGIATTAAATGSSPNSTPTSPAPAAVNPGEQARERIRRLTIEKSLRQRRLLNKYGGSLYGAQLSPEDAAELEDVRFLGDEARALQASLSRPQLPRMPDGTVDREALAARILHSRQSIREQASRLGVSMPELTPADVQTRVSGAVTADQRSVGTSQVALAQADEVKAKRGERLALREKRKGQEQALADAVVERQRRELAGEPVTPEQRATASKARLEEVTTDATTRQMEENQALRGVGLDTPEAQQAMVEGAIQNLNALSRLSESGLSGRPHVTDMLRGIQVTSQLFETQTLPALRNLAKTQPQIAARMANQILAGIQQAKTPSKLVRLIDAMPGLGASDTERAAVRGLAISQNALVRELRKIAAGA